MSACPRFTQGRGTEGVGVTSSSSSSAAANSPSSSARGPGDPPPEELFRILVATDLHIGAYEKHRHRCLDSFVTFEEVLQVAIEKDIDFVLLGGDVFHENKPSQFTLHKTMELLREYCMGDRDIRFVVHGDRTKSLASKFGCANFEDPNLNVALPVFTLHGNHDDPTGPHLLSPVDLLAASGLVNYFGKAESCENINVHPVLLQKGETKLALYGLGHIRDERLNRAFTHKKVHFLRPSEATAEWFNLFVLHQNRVQRGWTRSAITDEMLAGFFDLVVWGHEHECRIDVERVERGGHAFEICQPGSTIATQLTPDEVKPKHIGLLEVYKTNYRVVPIPLQTVRPFYLEDIVLHQEEGLERTEEDVGELLASRVELLVER
eukprot:RCo022458